MSLSTFLNNPASRVQIQVLYIMSLKAESLSCWPQFSSKSCNTLFLCPREHMYFHNDQKTGWEREPARTICTEFFSVRRNLWCHYSFIMQASTGQQLTSAKRCSACSRTVRTLNADCPWRPFLCSSFYPHPQRLLSANIWEPLGLTPSLPMSKSH